MSRNNYDEATTHEIMKLKSEDLKKHLESFKNSLVHLYKSTTSQLFVPGDNRSLPINEAIVDFVIEGKATDEVPPFTRNVAGATKWYYQQKHPSIFMIKGEAGIGKSTFVKQLCYAWSQAAEERKSASNHRRHRGMRRLLSCFRGSDSDERSNDLTVETEIFQEIFLLLAVRLRSVKPANTMFEMVLNDIYSRMPHAEKRVAEKQKIRLLIERLNEINNRAVLIVFDGWDEWDKTESSCTELSSLFEKTRTTPLLHNIIITTRPHADPLSDLQDVSTSLGEIARATLVGFQTADMKQFVQAYISRSNLPSHYSNLFLMQIESNFWLEELCHTPLLLALACNLSLRQYSRQQALSDVNVDFTLPNKLTDLFTKFCQQLLTAYNDKQHDTNKIIDLASWRSHPAILVLSKFAFDLLMQEKRHGVLIFSLKMAKEAKVDVSTMCEIGFLQSFRKYWNFPIANSDDDYFEFPHKTFQEYFAAVHLASALNEEPSALPSAVTDYQAVCDFVKQSHRPLHDQRNILVFTFGLSKSTSGLARAIEDSFQRDSHSTTWYLNSLRQISAESMDESQSNRMMAFSTQALHKKLAYGDVHDLVRSSIYTLSTIEACLRAGGRKSQVVTGLNIVVDGCISKVWLDDGPCRLIALDAGAEGRLTELWTVLETIEKFDCLAFRGTSPNDALELCRGLLKRAENGLEVDVLSLHFTALRQEKLHAPTKLSIEKALEIKSFSLLIRLNDYPQELADIIFRQYLSSKTLEELYVWGQIRGVGSVDLSGKFNLNFFGKKFPELTVLSLRHLSLQGHDFRLFLEAAKESCPNIRFLDVNFNRIDSGAEAAGVYLSQCIKDRWFPNFKTLLIGHNQLRGDSILELALAMQEIKGVNLTLSRNLSLAEQHIFDSFLAIIKDWPECEELGLHHCMLSEDQIHKLLLLISNRSGLKGLKKMYLVGNSMSNEGKLKQTMKNLEQKHSITIFY